MVSLFLRKSQGFGTILLGRRRVGAPRTVFHAGIPCGVSPPRRRGSASELSGGEGVTKGRDFQRETLYCYNQSPWLSGQELTCKWPLVLLFPGPSQSLSKLWKRPRGAGVHAPFPPAGPDPLGLSMFKREIRVRSYCCSSRNRRTCSCDLCGEV